MTPATCFIRSRAAAARRGFALLVLLLGSSVAFAQAPGPDVLSLHGYGHVQAERSHETARPSSELEHDLSFLGTWAVTPRLKAWLQVAHLSEVGRLRLDWSFASLDLSEATTVYAGQARLPVALNNELRDVQALRPSATLPLLYDDDLGLADEALRGVLLEHRRRSPGLGEFTVEVFAAGAMVPDAAEAQRGQVVGGRVAWQPEDSDWTWKASGYTGHLKADAQARQRKQTVVLSTRLDRGDWSFQAEVGHARLGQQQLDLAYGQLDRALGPAWRAFGRVDLGRSQQGDEAAISERRLTAGLAWQAHPNWGLRLEWSHHRGRLVQDDDDGDGDDTGQRRVWNQLAVAVNYLF